MAKDNSRIIEMIEKGKSSKDIRKATRLPIMRIAGVRAAHTRAGGSSGATRSRGGRRTLSLKVGTDVHKLVQRLLKLKVDSKVLAAATGHSCRAIHAIKAHLTMGTY